MTTAHELADLLERSFHGGAWHGPSVAEALEGVEAAAAAQRPIGAAHTIWEIVHHLMAWNEVPQRRLDGERIGDLSPDQDWPPVEDTSDERWQLAVEALKAAHQSLHTRLSQLTDEELEAPVPGSDPTVRGMVLGVLQHNAYHGGQIAVLRRAVLE